MTSTEHHFTVDTADLNQAIRFVKNGLSPSAADLSAQFVRVSVGGGKALLMTASGSLFCRCAIKVLQDDPTEEFAFAVYAVKLERLLAEAQAEKLTFSVDHENLQTVADQLTVNFATYDGSAIMQVQDACADHLALTGPVVRRDLLTEALKYARSCSTNTSIRQEINHTEIRNGYLLSSDGRKFLILESPGLGTCTLKVPALNLPAVGAALEAMQGDKLTVADNNAYFFIKTPDNAFSMGVRKIERKFPSIEQQIKNQGVPIDKVAIDALVLDSMLRGVALGLPTDEVRVSVRVTGSGPTAQFEVSTVNEAGRKSFKRVACGRTADQQLDFPLSFKHLLTTLAVFKGDSIVDILLYKAFCMIEDKNADRVVHTLVPFRTVEVEKQETQERERLKRASKVEGVTDDVKVSTDQLHDGVAEGAGELLEPAAS